MLPGSSRADLRVALPWIVRLRYAIAAGQAITCLLVDQLVGIDLPLLWLGLPPAVVSASNVWLTRRAERSVGDERDRSTVGWIFVLDTLCLTTALMLTGGPTNPFSLLYLVHITLAATILSQRQTWGLGALACLCFGMLFWISMPVPALAMHAHAGSARLHLVGMRVAFAVACFLVALFSGRISALLREREQSLLRMQDELAKKERLASLVTLAAGAAHELSTPLGTIAVAAKELEHYATRVLPNSTIADDSRLIRQEVDRCSGILHRMSLAGAEPVGEAPQEVCIGSLLEVVQTAFSSRSAVKVDLDDAARSAVLRVPRHAVEQALMLLVKNGLDASPAGGEVVIRGEVGSGLARFAITDSGTGMGDAVLRRVGEPFFTTKEPGKGMGLGVFLVRTLAQRLDGRFELSSISGVGTRATLELRLYRVNAQSGGEIRR